MSKKRSESFFGMHFDFHAHPDQENIGEFCDYDTVDEFLREVKPDYVQCDTKGHAGVSSYPTKVGNPAPNMKGDILKMWRELTKKNGVSLYSHYSGVLDVEAAARHPEWAALTVEGKQSNQKWETSVFSPYVDELMIPQLIEMATVYGLDGVWVDGDCWGTIEDYSEYAAAAYKKATGLSLPAEDDEAGRKKYREFCRDGFRNYVKHYCDEVHKAAPDFEVASNWMYTSRAPERPYEGVAFISGDYSPQNSMRTAYFEGRAMQNSKKPWDLMAWGFFGGYVKEYAQLCAEASAVIALGGGFEVYNPQLVGTINKYLIPTWKKLADFCREREATCYKATPHREGAVLLSEKAFYEHKKGIFRGYSETNAHVDEAHALLYVLLDAGYSTELLLPYQIDDMSDGELSQYKFIAVPDLDVIEENIAARLKKYAEGGGSVVVCGTHATSLFESELGVKLGDAIGCEKVFPFSRGRRGTLKSDLIKVALNGASAVTKCSVTFRTNDLETEIFSTVAACGKGHFAGIYANIDDYQNAATAGVRDAFEDLVSAFYPKKAVEISGTRKIQVVLTEKNGALNVNLINVSGPHTDAKYANYDEILPIYDIGLSIEYPKAPTSVTEMPSGRKLKYKYENGRVALTLDKLDIHTVIVIK
ncbi:MAG: alpha-L-fucosidase [Clostridia bacterium]|nr:alpha-L-fucosidase [Clostridia bacterium]